MFTFKRCEMKIKEPVVIIIWSGKCDFQESDSRSIKKISFEELGVRKVWRFFVRILIYNRSDK